MRYLFIFAVILALCGCQASGNAHNANVTTNIFSMEF
jgi:hypothetical protein